MSQQITRFEVEGQEGPGERVGKVEVSADGDGDLRLRVDGRTILWVTPGLGVTRVALLPENLGLPLDERGRIVLHE